MRFKRLTLTQTQLFWIGLLLLGLGLLLNEWLLTWLFSADGELSPHNVVIIWLLDLSLVGIGLTLALSRSLDTLLNLGLGLFFTAALLYGVEQYFGYLNRSSTANAAAAGASAPRIWRDGDYTRDFFRPSKQLGYTVKPKAKIRSIKMMDNEPIYDVFYTIDAHHRRMTPQAHPDQRDRHLLFFGDSFVFGEGLPDDQTLPAQVAALAPRYRAYNYGLSGYGPQQMLAKLESGQLATEVKEQAGLAIYVFIDAHVERAIGSMFVYNNWGDQMPYYTTTWSGELVRRGNFSSGRPLLSSFYGWLGNTEFATYFQLNIPRLAPRHYQQTARIIAAARDAFEAAYGSESFYVLIYPDEGDYFEDIVPYFDQYGLTYLNYDEAIKLDPDQGLAIKGDGHPTGKANRLVAEWLVEDIGIVAAPH